jgi:hypothetical protein
LHVLPRYRKMPVHLPRQDVDRFAGESNDTYEILVFKFFNVANFSVQDVAFRRINRRFPRGVLEFVVSIHFKINHNN